MTTARELVDAVRPCLPLPGLTGVSLRPVMFTGRELPWGDDDGRSLGWLTEEAVIGHLWKACAGRGWSFGIVYYGEHFRPDDGWHVSINVGATILDPESATFTAKGTDAIAFCEAYRKAKEASNAKH